jgi:hypothetical protein
MADGPKRVCHKQVIRSNKQLSSYFAVVHLKMETHPIYERCVLSGVLDDEHSAETH